ncbi:hypothetical protein K7432_013089, partial [Basidiobolus ranarum]
MPLKNSSNVSIDHPLDFGTKSITDTYTKVEKESVDSTHSHFTPPSPTNLVTLAPATPNNFYKVETESTSDKEVEIESLETSNSNLSLLNLVEKAQKFTVTTNNLPISKAFLETPQ